MAPIVHGLRELYGDYATIVTLDLDRNGPNEYGPFIDALGYDPRYRPGLYILGPDGTVLNQWLGPVDARTLQVALVTAILDNQ
ncbi:MAG: hypothetical protein HYZ26_03215 [Chloroflexi bacterium]|nr:hypothetical protein [Chloroflexota bacterium]